MRRHHMYDQTFQRAFKRAVNKQACEARHTAHPPPLVRDDSNRSGPTFEPCRICSGHSDVSTTMIYTHVLKVGGANSLTA